MALTCAERQKRYRTKLRGEEVPSIEYKGWGFTRICKFCSTTFIGRRNQLFCSKEHSNKWRHENLPPLLKYGPTANPDGINKDGYIQVLCKGHPHANNRGYILQHRLVMEEHLGRYLESYELVHHRNGIKTDNRLENLEIVTRDTHQGEVICPHCQKSFSIK